MLIKSGNQAILSGPIPRDAEYSTVGNNSTPLTKLSVKIGEKAAEPGQRGEAIWMNCVCWRDLAKTAASYSKGDTVFVAGKYTERKYTGREGDERTAIEVVADFITRMPSASQRSEQAPTYKPEIVDLPDDEELPDFLR